MGQKAAKLTQKATDTSQWLVQALEGIGSVTHRKMFGGYGLFNDGAMFAIVASDGDVFFKAGPQNRADFENIGAQPHGKMPYFRIPEDILSDDRRLRRWAKTAMAVARSAKGGK